MSKQKSSSKLSVNKNQENNSDLAHFHQEQLRQSKMQFNLSCAITTLAVTGCFSLLTLCYFDYLSLGETYRGVNVMLKILGHSVCLMKDSKKYLEKPPKDK